MALTLTAFIYVLSIVVAAALYATGVVPATFPVLGLQITAWVGGLTFCLLCIGFEGHREKRT